MNPCHPRCPNCCAPDGTVQCAGYREPLGWGEPYLLLDGIPYSLDYLDTELDAAGLAALLDLPVRTAEYALVFPSDKGWEEGDGHAR